MRDMQNQLKFKLHNDIPVLGSWSIISSPVVVEILALSGLDFLILDMEHGIYDQTALENCIRACEAAGCTPIVRIPRVDSAAAQWALDFGAHGIVVPQVTNAESAELAVGISKFSPEGTRGYNPFTRAANYAAPNSNQEGKLRNDFGVTAIIVENKIALNELDAILKIKNLDIVYVGIYDLSISLGFNGDTKNPKLLEIVEKAISKIREAKKIPGLMVRDKEDIAKAIKLGVLFLVYSVDTSIILNAAKEAVSVFKEVCLIKNN